MTVAKATTDLPGNTIMRWAGGLLTCLLLGFLPCVIAADPAGVLVIENGRFDKPGDTWMLGGGVPDGWTVEQHELRKGAGGTKGDAGSIGLNHRWFPMAPASPRSLYLISPNQARVSQRLKGRMLAGVTYQIHYGVFRYDWAPASVTMRLKVGTRTVLETTTEGDALARRVWRKERQDYVGTPEDAGQPVTLEFELSGKGDLRLDEVRILSIGPKMMVQLDSLAALTKQVAGLPTATAADRRKRGALALALEQASHLGEANLGGQMAALLKDIETALPRKMGRLVTLERGIGFFPATEVWEGNPYVEALLKWLKADLAKQDYPFPASTPQRPVFKGLSREYSSRDEARRMNQYLWLATHPRSPYREDPEVLTRLLRRAHAYMAEYALSTPDVANAGTNVTNSNLNDFFALGPALDAINGIDQAFPDLLLPTQKATWDKAVGRVRDAWLESCRLAEDQLYPMGKYCNRDLGVANILLNAGIYLDDPAAIEKAKWLVDAQAAVLYPDGGFAYIGGQNESGGYHQADCFLLARFYARSGDDKCLALLRGSRDYAALTIEPGNVTEYYTVPYWKTTWNSSYGEGGESVAALTGDPYIRGIIDQRHRYSGGASADPLAASWYREGIKAKPLPTDYLVIDRNIQGPRARFGRFSYAFNGRSYWNTEPGKMTFAGAMVVDPIDDKPNPLNAALMAVYPKVQVKESAGTEWQDWAYLSRYERNAVSVSNRTGALTTSYQTHLVTYGHSGTDVPWGGTQQWLGLPGRIVGMVEVFPIDGAQRAYQIDGRVRLGYGRSGPLRPKTIKVIDETHYEYGDLRVRVHDHNYAAVDIADSGVIRDDVRKATEIRFHDAQSQADGGTALKTYSPQDPHYFIVEVSPAWSHEAEAVEMLTTPEGLRGLRVKEAGRTVWLIHNPSETTQSYAGNLAMKADEKAVQVKSGTPSLPEPLVAGDDGRITLKVGPHSHVMIVVSAADKDLAPAPANFDEVAYGRRLVMHEDFETSPNGDTYQVGDMQVGWTGTSTIKQASDASNASKYVTGSSTSIASAADPLASFGFEPVSGCFAVEYRLRGYRSKRFSNTVSLYHDATLVTKTMNVNNSLRLDTLLDGSLHRFAASGTEGEWFTVRMECSTTRRSNNMILHVNGKVQKVLTVPGLVGRQVNRVAFGYLANFDDVRIEEGAGTFNMPADPTPYIERDKRPFVAKRSPAGLPAATGAALFEPFLGDDPPTIVTEMGEEAIGDVVVRKLVFRSLLVGEEENHVYAIIGRPAADGVYPGIMWLHGGGGFAEQKRVEYWAQQGYVAIALDEPGIANASLCPNSAGPWKFLPYNVGRWYANPDGRDSALFDGIVAELQAYALLRSLPNVDAQRCGVTGVSWGGYSTTMVCGLLGDRVKAAYSIYGCGFYDAGSSFVRSLKAMPADQQERWYRDIDAGRRTAGMTCAYFLAAAVKDTFFYPPSAMATLRAIPAGRNQVFAPIKTHSLKGVPGQEQMAKTHFDYHLKGEGGALPRVTVHSAETQPDGSYRVTFGLVTAVAARSGMLYYSLPGPPWPKRVWTGVEAQSIGDHLFSASLPAEAVAQNANWYVLGSDARPATGSSLLHDAKTLLRR